MRNTCLRMGSDATPAQLSAQLSAFLDHVKSPSGQLLGRLETQLPSNFRITDLPPSTTLWRSKLQLLEGFGILFVTPRLYVHGRSLDAEDQTDAFTPELVSKYQPGASTTEH